MYEQMDFFKEKKTELDLVWEKLAELSLSQGKMRRRLFSELSDVRAELIEVKAENDRLVSIMENERLVG